MWGTEWDGKGMEWGDGGREEVVAAGGSVGSAEAAAMASDEAWSNREVFVGAVEITDLIRVGTSEGVMFSITVKAGRRMTLVGCLPRGWSWECSGTGILDAESMSLCDMC